MKTMTIYCADCFSPREIKPQDAFQVKRCVDCQRKYAGKRRNLLAKVNREMKQERLAELMILVDKHNAGEKLRWEEWCKIKFGRYDFNGDDALRRYGFHECAASIGWDYEHEHYDEPEILTLYERSQSGDTLTEDEVRTMDAKRARYGAEALAQNEFDCYGDYGMGRDTLDQWVIEDAIRREGGKAR